MSIVKNTRKVLSLLVLALLCCALLIGCESGGSKGVTEIFVQKTDMPRLTYAQGQELDLHGGILTVVVDGETSPVPMDSPDVTVSGYNKDQLGTQTVTITYKGKTTTIDVTVAARLTAEGFETNYFVGDTYDNSKGKLKVLKADGSYASVNLNSNEVTFKSFDSSKAGKATVTVTYDGEDCSFDVTVHEVANIRLTSPKKLKYVSHETELSLAGGYLTVEAPAPSTFSKFVTLTADMISGYDPSQMTYETRDQVIKQTILVSYSGKQASYEVEIAYSDVHLVQYLAQQLTHLDWTQEEMPEMSDADAENAILAIQTYLGLTPVERDNIDEATLHAVLFPATIAMRTTYLAEMETFSDAFTMTSDARLALVGKSYEALAVAVARLEDPTDPFNVYADLLLQINSEFGDTEFMGSQLKNWILAHNADTAQTLIHMFNYMMNLHDLLKDIPTDWTVETLQIAEHETNIATVLSKIIIGEYQGASYNTMYRALSSWREKDDFCDILYTYYAYIKVGGMDELKDGLWQVIPMPGLLSEWYMNFMQAVSQEQYMMNYENTNAYLHDTAGFMFYYFQTLECAAKIQNSDNQLYQNLYRMLDFDYLIESNLRCGPRGYLYHMGAGLDSEKVQEAWEKVMVILDIYVYRPETTFAEAEAEFRAVLDVMMEMSPSDLYAFVSSMNFLYDSSRGTVMVLDCTTRIYNTMMNLLASFYYNTLPRETVFPCFQNLMIAMENYSLRGIKETALDEFKVAMENMMAAYEGLSKEDKAIFDNYLGEGYGRYLAIYSRLSANKPVELGQWEAKMEELLWTMEKFDETISFALSSTTSIEEKSRTMPVVMALYEKALRLHIELANAGGDVAQELFTRTYEIEGMELTLDYYFSAVRNLFVKYMLSAGISTDTGESYMLWDLYGQSAVRPVLAQMADLLLAEREKRVYEGNDVYNIMLAFRSLTPADKNTFFILGVNQTYYAALERYFYSKDASLTEMVPSLLRAEIAYAVYQHNQTSENRANFIDEFANTMAAYEKLANKDQLDDSLRQMYELYKEAYNNMKG